MCRIIWPAAASSGQQRPAAASSGQQRPAAANAWDTVATVRNVLVVGRTVTALTRLLDVLSLLRSDHRIQVKFTHDPGNPANFAAGVRELLESMEADVIPWERAVTDSFDLTLAASENDRLHELHAPVLLFPHGIGYQKYYPGSTTVAGMDPQRLLQDGRVIPSLIALSHHGQRRELTESCSDAVAHAAVVGDPCLDRLLASQHLDASYRAALGASGVSLIVLASTWGEHSLFGNDPGLPERLLQELPVDEYLVALVLHPGIWSGHSPWQIRSWLTRARESGLLLIPPQEGWRAAMVAASCVLSDEGSMALYAAALDKPLLLAGRSSPVTMAGSPLVMLAATADELHKEQPLLVQIEEGMRRHEHGKYQWIVDRAVTYQGASATKTRRAVYRLMDLPEPAEEAVFPPAPTPEPISSPTQALVAGGRGTDEGVVVTRYPVASTGAPAHEQLDHRHIVAHVDHADRTQMECASILCPSLHRDDRWRFGAIASSLLAKWPHAELIAAAVGRWTCLVGFRSGRVAAVTVRHCSTSFDPLALASHVYVRMRTGETIPERDHLYLGQHVVELAVKTEEAGRAR